MSLPLPPFFDPAAASRVYRVPYQERADQAREWAAAHGIRPAAGDEKRTALLLVDVQNTFCLPEFELFVGRPLGPWGRRGLRADRGLPLPQPRPHHAGGGDPRHAHRRADLPPALLGGPRRCAPRAAHRDHPRRRRERPLAGEPGARAGGRPARGLRRRGLGSPLRPPPRRGRQVPARRVAVPLDGGRHRPRDGLGGGGGRLLPRDRAAVADPGGDQGAEPPHRELLRAPARGDGGRVGRPHRLGRTAPSSSTCCPSTR